MPATGYIDNYYARHIPQDRKYPVLAEALETNVCVIGGGLAGLNTALGLIERGMNVVLVEAKRVGWGASGRNGGFVDKGYAAGEADLAAKLGIGRAQGLVTLTKRARGLIKKRIADYNIDCGPVIDGVINISMHDNPEKIKRYIASANKGFDLGYEFWPREKVREHCRSEKYFDAFFSPHDFQFNPLSYLHGLARVITEKGGQIFESSPAARIVRAGQDWVVHTPQGSVKAMDIVLCCSTEIGGLDRRLDNAVFPVETYIMSTEPLDEALLASSVNTRHAAYELRFSCNYYRRTDDNRILWGGRVALAAPPHDIAADMLHDMFAVYPQLKGKVKPETAWSGLLSYAPHKMPQIGFFEEGYWYNTAFGGHGLLGTTVGGEVVASAIADGDRTFRQFAPFSPFYAGGKAGQYVAHLIYYWWRTRDYLGI